MKVAALLAGIALLLCSCDRKPAVTPPTPSGEGEQSASIPPAREPSIEVTATKEQIGSSVGVRVVAGALPVVNVTGAILHRDELPADEPFFDQHRCVVTLLKGWKDAQLNSEKATILIFRNLPDDRGQPQPHAYRGKLLEFDEKTGIALITYPQGFSAATDLGFKIDRGTSAPVKAPALRYGSADPGEEAILLSQRRRKVGEVFQPIPVEEGQMDITRPPTGGKLTFPPRDPAQDSAAVLIAAGSDSLIGFASENPAAAGTTELVRIPPLQFSLQVPVIAPLSAAFSKHSPKLLRILLKAERKGGAESLNNVWVRYAAVPPGTQVDLATYAEPYPTIAVTAVDHFYRAHFLEDQTISSLLPVPQEPGEEITYLVQVAWALSDADIKPSLNSRPFLVKLANRNEKISAITEGIAGPSALAAEEKARATTFTTESPVVRMFEIAEGKEVLMQLQGDPHWKRFSMEKKTWLPLPPSNLSTVELAGNRSSLILLDRAAGELRRYQLSDLKFAATARLSVPGEEILALRAGSLSDEAPIHVLCSGGPISLDAKTLQRIDNSDERSATPFNTESAGYCRATGDGTALISRDSSSPTFSFRGETIGLRLGYFDADPRRSLKGVMVSGAFAVERQTVSTCATPGGVWKPLIEEGSLKGRNRLLPFTNAPVVGRLVPGDPKSIPLDPARMELFSLWHATPFATVPTPEFARLVDTHGVRGEPENHICVDLNSRRIGVLSEDKTTWTVRDFPPPADTGQPILLNWPETTIARGGEFRFVPVLSGKARLLAELLGSREATPVTIDGDNGITFRIAENELASLLVLNLTITGEKNTHVASIPIHVSGTPLPFVWPDLSPRSSADDFGNGFRSLTASKDRRVPLKTHFYESPDPIQEILIPTSDVLALITGANRIDLFSLSSRKLAGRIQSSQTAKYFAGCEALFEYETKSRTLTRISVPDGTRGAQISLPEAMKIDAIAFGSQRDHPVSLFLNKRYNERSAQIGPWKYTTWQSTRGLAVVDSETLQSGNFTQPRIWTKLGTEEAANTAIYPGVSEQMPVKIASSLDGSVLHLAGHFGMILPHHSIVAPYPENFTRSGLYSHSPRAEGSITGITATSSGFISRNGLLERNGRGALGTPCGRYTVAKLDVFSGGSGTFEVRSLENERPIFRLNRVAAVRADPDPNALGAEPTIQVLGVNGPAVIKSRGRRLLQFIEFDIPNFAAQVAPDHLHVVSQPSPFVMEGTAYEYQVKTNNPNLVRSFRLREDLPNTTISPSGMLRMIVPSDEELTDRISVAIEIETSSGNTVLHDFSVVVLGKKLNPAPQAPKEVTPPSSGPDQPPTL